MTQREHMLKFEKDRIIALQEERLHIQKKTFTKWMNSFLQKARMEVNDIFTDLADGRKLLKLLEIISGEKLGKPNNGKMRVHKIENVNKSLAFLHTKVRLESIGAEDIVDGNKTLILGLLWTIILRFQIQGIEFEGDLKNSEKKHAKEALLLWCQRKTAGYPYVNVQDFTHSWRSGMAFNALIHAHRPDIIDYNNLNPHNHIETLNNAFDTAQRELAVSKLLDAEDVDTAKPDEKSVMTYVSAYYHTFARMNSEMKGGRRIANIIAQLMDCDRSQLNYELFTTNLLNWLRMKIVELDDRNLPNSLDGIQKEFLKFKEYRTIEKPPKYKERSEIEALLFKIQTQMKALGQPVYLPTEGKLVQDIEKAWTGLEKAEYRREVALREQLLRLEKLENLAFRFERKSVLREGYLIEMIQVLNDPRYGSNLTQVEATVKKHEAISVDILARSDRFSDLRLMAQQLIDGNYHRSSAILVRESKIYSDWNQLLALLKKHENYLTGASSLMSSLREVNTIRNSIFEIEKSLSSDSNVAVNHLLAVEELLQRHGLLEAHIASHEETIRKLNQISTNLIPNITNDDIIMKELPILNEELSILNSQYKSVIELSRLKRSKLLEMRAYYQFVQDIEEEETTISERQRICQAILPSKDLLGVISLQQKHSVLESEIKAHKNRLNKVIDSGEALIRGKHAQMDNIESRIESLKAQCNDLEELTQQKSKQLNDAIEAFQYHADANEAESWIKEKMQIISSEDYGNSETSATALLQRHSRLESEIRAYQQDIDRLDNQSDKMVKSGIASLFVICGDAFTAATAAGSGSGSGSGSNTLSTSEPIEEGVEWVDELVEREVIEDVFETIQIPMVRALYPYRGQDNFAINKGETMILLQKTNNDWWSVRRERERTDGFVPANYVQEIQPKIVKKLVQKPVKVWEKQKVAKLLGQQKKSPKKSIKRNSKRRLSIICDAESVEQRKKNIDSSYDELCELSKLRKQYLCDSIQYFRFNRECDSFDAWMYETEKAMLDTTRNYYNQQNSAVNDSTVNSTSAVTSTVPIEILRKKFSNFITELSANRSRVDEIDRMAIELTSSGTQRYLSKIKQTHSEIHVKWDKLNKLMHELGLNVEGLTTVELFNTTCDETVEWMLEKLNKIEDFGVDFGRDLKTVQALHRRHDNIERELSPIEEKFTKVNILADSVKNSFPNENNNVCQRQQELNEIWEKVKQTAIERRAKLDESLGLQVLKNSSKDLFSWIRNHVKQQLNSEQTKVKDVSTIEMLLKQHEDLGQEIAAHNQDFNDLRLLAKQLIKQMFDSDSNQEILTIVNQLNEEQEAIHREWQEKTSWLRQSKDLLIFNEEADYLDAYTNSWNGSGSGSGNDFTVDSQDHCLALMKSHDNLMATLLSQDERLHLLNDMSEKLIEAKHYDSQAIDRRRKSVIEKRVLVKEKALLRKRELNDLFKCVEFIADCEDFLNWCSDKKKIAEDESYKDLVNMKRKLKKFEAFEAELLSNQSRLSALNCCGNELLMRLSSDKNSDKINSILVEINNSWQQLVERTEYKGKRLRQANDQLNYKLSIEQMEQRVNELLESLQSKQYGNDLRSCKQLLTKHQLIENEVELCGQRISELVLIGSEISQTHVNSNMSNNSISNLSKRVSDAFSRIKTPLEERKLKLEAKLNYFQFEFEVNAELQWIRERILSAKSTDYGQNLTDTQNLMKKFQQNLEREIEGHKPLIEKTFKNGSELVSRNSNELQLQDSIQQLIQQLLDSWKQLIELSLSRKQSLELSLKIQQLLSEANEVELWMNEKLSILSSDDLGRDCDSVVKLLTKHKAIELEIDSYSGLISEMKSISLSLSDSDSNAKICESRMQDIEQQMNRLQRLSNQRRLKLIESKSNHEFFFETELFLIWIREQMQMALSEDCGQDYEHLLIIQSKFIDFKLKVKTNQQTYEQINQLAAKLTKNEINQTIEKRMKKVSKQWIRLLDSMDSREQKLRASAKIHRFNRDVAEALHRIQQKFDLINNISYGNSLNSCQSLIRSHEVFENDLVALEAQLQVLVDDSVRLQSLYPGGNAQHIVEQQSIVIEQWEALLRTANQTKHQLQQHFNIFRTQSQIRDISQWAKQLIQQMDCNNNLYQSIRDPQSAQLIKLEHQTIKSEIETREPTFNSIVQTVQQITENNDNCIIDLNAMLNELLNTRHLLLTSWQMKQLFLDQLIDINLFLRDVKQLEQLTTQQEVNALNQDLGQTVEEIDANIRKHESFEKLVNSNEEKLQNLQESGTKLIKQNHFDSETVKQKLDEITAKRSKLKELIKNKRQRLIDGLVLAQFTRDITEAENWIETKFKQLESNHFNHQKLNSLDDKIKKLQKHQTFEAELSAHNTNISEIKQKGDHLIAKSHELSLTIRSQLEHLLNKWKELLLASEQTGRGLEEAQDILDFTKHVDKVESWIREKQLLIQHNDTGEDYEHCLALQRKLDDVDSDMRVDETRIKLINILADKLLRQQTNEISANHQRRREELNQNWNLLQISIESYRNKLQNAVEVHRFNRDLQDLDERISEKCLILEKQEEIKNLEAVEALQRKQDKIEREVNAIEVRLKELIDIEGKKLIAKHSDITSNCRNKINNVQQNYRQLCKLFHKKRQSLSSAYILHKFLEDVKEIEKWANNIINDKMSNKSNLLANNINDIRNELQQHDDIKTEINARKDTFLELKDFGHRVLQQISQQEDSIIDECDAQIDNSKTKSIENGLNKLDDLRRLLDQIWEERKHLMTQYSQMQRFNDQLTLADAWLSSKEAFLNNEDLGDTLANVESLIKKHHNFEKTLSSQKRINELEKFANDLIDLNHFESSTILSKCTQIIQRRDRLLELSKHRKNKLNDSRLYQKFVRTVNEIIGWLNEKLKVASDQSYRDPINLLSKIQKLAAFEAELASNKDRIDSVVNEGETLINSGHFMSEDVKTIHLSNISKVWRNVLDETNVKKERLQDAYQALQFYRMIDDLDSWITDIETALQDEDHGRDLISCENILKKHQLIENDINNHNENIEQVKDLMSAFIQNSHFLKEDIEERAKQIIQRYDTLHEPMMIRRENLEEALVLFQLKRDVEDEMIWIKENEAKVMTNDLGVSLIEVQRLKKKHAMLESEITSREPILTTLISKGYALIRSQHFASKTIESLVNELQNKIQQLKDCSAIRRLRLLDAIESQQFYSDANEAENWCAERIQFLTSDDNGRDEESVQTLAKKLDIIKRDLDRYINTNLSKLMQLSNGLLERNHFDSDIIKTNIIELENKFKQILELCDRKSIDLNEKKKYFSFIRDAEELIVWIKEQTIIANSEDYGHDVEHVELLIQRFDNFIINLNSNEERIVCLKSSLQSLNIGEESAREYMNEIVFAWNELKDSAQSRQDALIGAKHVHTFDRSADETIAWIHQKNSSTALDESILPDDDLLSIQTMIRSHEGFERDLAAVREQVEALVEEAKRLATMFPDASDHIYSKNDSVKQSWNALLHKSSQRRNHLLETETLQTIFDEFRELMSWINEMIALITAEDELGTDVMIAETQLHRHIEYKLEIDARNDSFDKFIAESELIINSGHFMSEEIRERINRLCLARNNLSDIWNKRKLIYEQNVDAQHFKKDAILLEQWIESREPFVNDPHLGDSIADVDDLIRKHEDFEKAILAQEEKLKGIQRITLIEEYFKKQMLEEEEMKKAEIARNEHQRMEQLKQMEQMKIIDQRKHEDSNYDDFNDRNSDKKGDNMIQKVKRTESVKFVAPKSTPSFTTRRRSFQSTSRQPLYEPNQLPPVECEGVLDRKQELQNGGKRATVRSWKTYHTVLCGQLLCFFKDKHSFSANIASAPPFSVLGAKCSRAIDYHKRKYVFRLQVNDGSEFLFTAQDENNMTEWLNKIAFHASLPPAMQLLSYDAHKDASVYSASNNSTSNAPYINNDNSLQSNVVSSPSSSSPELSLNVSVSSNPTGLSSPPITTSRSSSDNLFPIIHNETDKTPPPLPPPRTSITMQKQLSEDSGELSPSVRPVSERIERPKEEVDYERSSSYNDINKLTPNNGDFNNHEQTQTTYQNIPVSRHMSLTQNVSRVPETNTSNLSTQQSAPQAMTAINTSSEEDISYNPRKSKKKAHGVMSFFKRSK